MPLGYQCSTNPGSVQLAVPTKIPPPGFVLLVGPDGGDVTGEQHYHSQSLVIAKVDHPAPRVTLQKITNKKPAEISPSGFCY
jgi:hypothetical protein